MAEAANRTSGAIWGSVSCSRKLQHAAQLSPELGFKPATCRSLADLLDPLSYRHPLKGWWSIEIEKWYINKRTEVDNSWILALVMAAHEDAAACCSSKWCHILFYVPRRLSTIQPDRLDCPREEESRNKSHANPALGLRLLLANVWSEGKEMDKLGLRLEKQHEIKRLLSPQRPQARLHHNISVCTTRRGGLCVQIQWSVLCVACCHFIMLWWRDDLVPFINQAITIAHTYYLSSAGRVGEGELLVSEGSTITIKRILTGILLHSCCCHLSIHCLIIISAIIWSLVSTTSLRLWFWQCLTFRVSRLRLKGLMCPSKKKTECVRQRWKDHVWTQTSVICVFCFFFQPAGTCQPNPFCLQKVSLSRTLKPTLFLDWPSCIFEMDCKTWLTHEDRQSQPPKLLVTFKYSWIMQEYEKRTLHLHISVVVVVSVFASRWTKHAAEQKQVHRFTGSLLYSTLVSPRHQITHQLAVSDASVLLLHLSSLTGGGSLWDLPYAYK